MNWERGLNRAFQPLYILKKDQSLFVNSLVTAIYRAYWVVSPVSQVDLLREGSLGPSSLAD